MSPNIIRGEIDIEMVFNLNPCVSPKIRFFTVQWEWSCNHNLPYMFTPHSSYPTSFHLFIYRFKGPQHQHCRYAQSYNGQTYGRLQMARHCPEVAQKWMFSSLRAKILQGKVVLCVKR